MPYIRFITSFFLLIIFFLAAFGAQNHPWFTDGVLWSAVLFALFVCIMSLRKVFFLDMMATFFVVFFLQRIVVIYFRPDQMSYQEYLKFSPQVFNAAIWFCIGVVIAILGGYFLAISHKKTINASELRVINFDKFFGISYDFERLFNVYSLFFYVAMILEIFLIVKFKVGVTALEYGRQFAPFIRIVNIVETLYFLPLLVLAKGKFSPYTRNVAISLVVLILIRLIFFQTSKAGIISLCVTFFVCQYFCGAKISKKNVITGFALFIFSIFILAPVTTIMRASVIRMVSGSSSFGAEILMVKNNYVLTIDKPLFSFMNRLGAFDWLVGFINVGRDAFLPLANVFNDFVEVVNSLVPGDLINSPYGGMSVEKLIPHVLRGWDLGSYLGHAELMGGVGMAYLYFGVTGGILFFFFWSYSVIKMLKFSRSAIAKTLIFIALVINFFLGGSVITSIKIIYEGLIMLFILIFISKGKLYKLVHDFFLRVRT